MTGYSLEKMDCNLVTRDCSWDLKGCTLVMLGSRTVRWENMMVTLVNSWGWWDCMWVMLVSTQGWLDYTRDLQESTGCSWGRMVNKMG